MASTAHGTSLKVYTRQVTSISKVEAMLTMAQYPNTQVYECHPVYLDKDKLAIKRVKLGRK